MKCFSVFLEGTSNTLGSGEKQILGTKCEWHPSPLEPWLTRAQPGVALGGMKGALFLKANLLLRLSAV